MNPDKERKTKSKNTALIIVIIFAIVFALALAAVSAVLVRRMDSVNNENYIWENYSVTVTMNFYDGTKKHVTTLINDTVVLEEPPEVAGHTFLGWENENGKLIQPSEITAKIDEEYTAKYIVSLNTEDHNAYIFADDSGFFHADEMLTRGDAALMVWCVLSEKQKSMDKFEDIEAGSEYAEPAAALKKLGIYTDKRFYPEDEISRGDFISMLAAFYPNATGQYSFSDLTQKDPYYDAFRVAAERGWIEHGEKISADADSSISRIDAVKLMNRILGRDASELPPEEYVGGILEYSPGDDYYLPLIEAAVDHKYERSAGIEKWTLGTAFEKHPEGMLFIGGRLHYVGEDGHFASNIETEGFTYESKRDTVIVDGFKFGDDGIYTCGDPELDALVYEVIDSIYQEGMSREELLHELFEYTVSSFKYLRRNYYKYGDMTYAQKEAYLMLTTGKGNCYSYAGTFCMFARALGYNAVVFSGTVGKDYEPHGWCEIIEDDIPYICDAELVMKHRQSGKDYDMFFKQYEELRGWTYNRYTRK